MYKCCFLVFFLRMVRFAFIRFHKSIQWMHHLQKLRIFSSMCVCVYAWDERYLQVLSKKNLENCTFKCVHVLRDLHLKEHDQVFALGWNEEKNILFVYSLILWKYWRIRTFSKTFELQIYKVKNTFWRCRWSKRSFYSKKKKSWKL